MTTDRVDVVVTERGTRVVQRNLESLGNAAQQSEGQVQLLNRALRLIGTYFGVREVLAMVDAYTNLQNRLRQVTTGTGNLAAVTNELFNVSNRTRSSYEGTATLYARVALATKELGVSQQELLTFTERVNQAIILSGASGQEAYGGLIQFSQGLASGALRGDELRSVLEQLPAVADIIANHLGVTRGQLRLLGAEGKITTDIILAAFRNAENVAEAFANTIPNLSQAATVARNQFMRLIGDLDRSLGITESLSRTIIGLSTDMDTLAASVLGLSAAVAVLAGPAVLGLLLRVLTAIWAVIARNPIGILISAATGLVVAMGQLNDKLDDTLRKLGYVASAGDKLAATWAGVRAYIERAWENFPEWLASIFIRAINGAQIVVAEGLNKFGDLLDKLTGKTGTGRIDISQLNLVPEPGRFAAAGDAAAQAYREAFNKTLLTAAQANQGGLNGAGPGGGVPPIDPNAAKELAKLSRELDRLVNRADPTAGAWRELAEAQDVLNRAWGAGLITLEQYNDLNGQVYRSLEDQLFPIEGYIKALNRQQEVLQLDTQARERANAVYQLEDQIKRKLLPTERELVDAALRRTQQMQLEAELLDELNGPLEQYYRNSEALLNLLGSGAIDEQQYRNALLDNELQMLRAYPSVANDYRAALLELEKVQNQLNDAVAQGTINMGQFKALIAGTQIDLANLQLTTANFTLGDFFTASLDQLYDGFQGVAVELSQVMGNLWQTIGDGAADAIGNAIVYGEDLGSTLQDVARTAVSQLISALIKLGIQWVISQTVGQAAAAATTASTLTQAQMAATAWAPAAALASLATAGANAIAADTALVSTVGLANALALFGKGYKEGGYTGDVATDAFAGFVHGREFVINAAATARNRPYLEAMNRGADMDDMVAGRGGFSGNIYVINETGVPMEAEAQYTTAGDVEIIAKRIVREETPNVVARDLDNSNGPVRKSLARNTNVQSKRNGNA